MIDLDVRRHARALERINTALRANPSLNDAQRTAYVDSFERGWRVASGSTTKQEFHTQSLCDQIARHGRGPTPPGRPCAGRAAILAAA